MTFQRCRKSGQSAGVGGAGVLGGVFPGDPPTKGPRSAAETPKCTEEPAVEPGWAATWTSWL